MEKNALYWLAYVLVIIGAINWGLIGLLGLDLVAAIFGPFSLITRIVYVLVGLAGLYLIFPPLTRRQTRTV